MTRKKLTVAKAPCKTCPYRRDVPSGVWAKEEYEKLPPYDDALIDQAFNGGRALFDCHQSDGNLCAGWVGCHGSRNLLALRLANSEIDDAVLDYKSPVPLFKSGTEAAFHGMKKIRRPDQAARRAIATLIRKRDRRRS